MSTKGSTPSSTSWKIVVLVIGAATLVVLGPLIFHGIPATRDFLEHLHIAVAFFKSMSVGDLMPSWPADVNGGYGDVSVRIYPPGLSILWAAARLLTGSWYLASVAVFGLLTFAGGIGTWLWAREFTPSKYAVWAGALFILTPYHVTELFTASLLAEYAAVCVLPFAFAFSERICRSGTKREVACLGAAYALLVLFNLPLTVIGSYSLLLYFVVTVDRSRILESSLKFASGLSLGLLCSVFYWVTVVAELPWMRPDTEHPFSSINFVFATLRQNAQDSGVAFANLILLTTLAILIPAAVLVSGKLRDENKKLIWAVGSVTLVAFFMSTLPSYPLWFILPKLKEVQLPWRWLAVGSIGAPVLLAASIPAWRRIFFGKQQWLALIAIGFVLVPVAFSISHPIRETRYLSRSEIQTLSLNVVGTATIGQWFPFWARGEPTEMPEEAVAEGRQIILKHWSPEHRSYAISEGAGSEVRIRTYYYPLWVATASGQKLPTHPASDGALLITVPSQAVSFDLDFREPPRAFVSSVVSIVASLLLLALAVPGGRKGRNISIKTPVSVDETPSPDIAEIP